MLRLELRQECTNYVGGQTADSGQLWKLIMKDSNETKVMSVDNRVLIMEWLKTDGRL